MVFVFLFHVKNHSSLFSSTLSYFFLSSRDIKSCRSEGRQLYQKETSTQVFSSEYCEILKKTYFEESL